MPDDMKLTADNPSMDGIFAGICKGKVWYDNKYRPSIGVAYSYCVGGHGIIGKLTADRKWNRDFFEKIFCEIRQSNEHEFEFSTEDKELCNDLLALFEEKEISSEMEYSYRINHKIELHAEGQNSTIQYHIVDKNILDKVKQGIIDDCGLLTDRMENSWTSTEDFLRKSKAVVAVHENKIVGVIFGSGRYKEFIVVDIEVLEKYRRLGIATVLVEKFVNECIENGLVVQWDHIESNVASRNLALKADFVPFKQRPYYWFSI